MRPAGIALSVLCVVGLAVLALRRLTSARVQAVTTTMDLVVLAVLLVQIVLGLAVAVHYRWGAAWGATPSSRGRLRMASSRR